MKILKAWSNQADGVGHGVPQQRHARGSLYGIAAPVRHCRPRGLHRTVSSLIGLGTTPGEEANPVRNH